MANPLHCLPPMRRVPPATLLALLLSAGAACTFTPADDDLAAPGGKADDRGRGQGPERLGMWLTWIQIWQNDAQGNPVSWDGSDPLPDLYAELWIGDQYFQSVPPFTVCNPNDPHYFPCAFANGTTYSTLFGPDLLVNPAQLYGTRDLFLNAPLKVVVWDDDPWFDTFVGECDFQLLPEHLLVGEFSLLDCKDDKRRGPLQSVSLAVYPVDVNGAAIRP